MCCKRFSETPTTFSHCSTEGYESSSEEEEDEEAVEKEEEQVEEEEEEAARVRAAFAANWLPNNLISSPSRFRIS